MSEKGRKKSPVVVYEIQILHGVLPDDITPALSGNICDKIQVTRA